jgi:ribosome biogenesis protein Tsr3
MAKANFNSASLLTLLVLCEIENYGWFYKLHSVDSISEAISILNEKNRIKY